MMTKNLRLNLKNGFLIFAIALFVASCGTDDGSVFDTPIPDDQTGGGDDDEQGTPEVTVATIIVNELDSSSDVLVASAVGEAGSTVPGRVQLTADGNKMRRLYITKNETGQGSEPFTDFPFDDATIKDFTKPDGSIDLDGDKRNMLDFTFDLPAPDTQNGSIVYYFWTTTGKGDFRDASKRLALGVGSITVTVGSGSNDEAPVKEFTNIELKAPAEDGSSENFFSIPQASAVAPTGGAEFRYLWDFGYFFTNSEGASFASSNAYTDAFPFNVDGFSPDPSEPDFDDEEVLNMGFFALSSLTAEDFDGISTKGQLENIMTASTQEINDLAIGDIIEFVDNYGNKGLIKITALDPGFAISNGITFDLKIQPSSISLD